MNTNIYTCWDNFVLMETFEVTFSRSMRESSMEVKGDTGFQFQYACQNSQQCTKKNMS